jgi:predicted MPP superfamily phosphohydrolase
VLFVAVVTVALFAMKVYVHRRATTALRLGRAARIGLAVVLVSGPVAIVVGRGLVGALPATLAEPLSIFGFTVALGVILSVALLFVVDATRVAAWAGTRGVGWIRRTEPIPVPEPAPVPEPLPEPAFAPAPALSRRDMLTHTATASALFVGGGSSVYGALFGRHDYQIEEVPIAIPGLAAALDGYAIVQLSDIHFGTFVGDPELRAAVALVRKARPDAVVLTGDLLDHDASYAPLLGQLVRALSPLARDGVFVIPGNHDYYAGVEAVLDAARRGGAKLLVNAGRVVGDRGGAFAMIGVDDVWTARNGFEGGPDLARALSTVPRDLPKILLCHNPVFFPEAAGEVALQLSGHTHGGQVNLVVRPADAVLPFGYVAGHYERDGSQLYVNRGFGTAGPPARIGAPPEVTKVVLTRG